MNIFYNQRSTVKCCAPFATLLAASMSISTIATADAIKEIKVSPVRDGRTERKKTATFTLTVPRDILQFKSIRFQARGNLEGNHRIELETHAYSVSENSQAHVAREYVEFTAVGPKQNLDFDISSVWVRHPDWTPGETRISFLIQGDEFSVEKIGDLIFTYASNGSTEDVDKDLVEPPPSPNKTKSLSRAPEPYALSDQDDDLIPSIVKPVKANYRPLSIDWTEEAAQKQTEATEGPRLPNDDKQREFSDQDEDFTDPLSVSPDTEPPFTADDDSLKGTILHEEQTSLDSDMFALSDDFSLAISPIPGAENQGRLLSFRSDLEREDSELTKAIPNAPSIGPIADFISPVGEPIEVLLTLEDTHTDAAQLILAASSNYEEVIPNSGLAFIGNEAQRRLLIQPTQGKTGIVEILVTAQEAEGMHYEERFQVHIVNPAEDEHSPVTIRLAEVPGEINQHVVVSWLGKILLYGAKQISGPYTLIDQVASPLVIPLPSEHSFFKFTLLKSP
ncbi:MAG: hypothetical protein ACFHW5_10145 [Verrucomicrobiota bacterium]